MYNMMRPVSALMPGGIPSGPRPVTTATSATATLPFVFVLDWDGTIAGRVEYQSQAYTLMQTLKRQGAKSVPGYNPAAAFGRETQLIRPGFASFMKALQEFYGRENVHFFIYTASEKQWAHHEIAIVEKEHGIKFARPIFTRDDCVLDTNGNYRKALAKVFPRICRAMAHDRPYTKAEKAYIMEYQTLIVDNNAVYTDHTDKLLLCPDYNYCVFENILDMIPRAQWRNPAVITFVKNQMANGAVCPAQCATDSAAAAGTSADTAGRDYMKSLVDSYTWLAVKCKQIVDANEKYAADDFWRYLKKTLVSNQVRNFSRHTVQQLQNAVWRHVKARPKAMATPGSAAYGGTGTGAQTGPLGVPQLQRRPM